MSTREFGCFFCEGKSTDPEGVCPKCGLPINVGAELLRLNLEGFLTSEILGRGYYGWTLKAEKSYRSFAVKLIPAHRLESEFTDKEAKALAACAPHRNIALFWSHFYTSVSVLDRSVNVLGLVFEYIENAQPLSKALADKRLVLSRKDLADILIGLSSGIARIHSKGLWHDDCHDDNILIRSVGPDENLSERFEVKLIDFGSARPLLLDEPERGDRSDYHYLAKHIYALTSCFENGFRGRMTPVDRAFSGRLRRLAQRLDDPDVSRRGFTPDQIVAQIKLTYSDAAKTYEFATFKEMKDSSSVSFSEPLENTNALSLAPQDIPLLFRDVLHWQRRLEQADTVIVAGPRGCGKTMLLRYMATQTQARPRKGENSPEEVRNRLEANSYIGFLVSAGQLRTPFIRSFYNKLEAKDRFRAEEFCREYISSFFILDVMRTVLWLKTERLANVSGEDIGLLHSMVRDLISGINNEVMTDLHSERLEILIEVLERHIGHLSNLGAPNDYVPSKLARDDALDKVTRALRASSWVGPRQIWFLLDDYSVTVLPAFVQRSYNSVLFNLPKSFRLKLSSEGDGPILEDHLNRKYQEGRELTRVNLGEVYFAASEQEGRTFFEQILDARFKELERGSLADITTIMSEHRSLDRFGEYIGEQKRPGLAQFYGFGLVCRLCSGDVSFIIELLHALVQGRWGDDAKPLSPARQDDIIKHFAQRQLVDLKRITEYGSALYMFAERLGNLLKAYLLASVNDPDERLRIEIEGVESLSQAAQKMENALLRHSVLIEGGVGKSREGLPTRKLYFRRLFAPCFPFSPNRKGCIAIKVPQYEKWLLNPDSIPKLGRKARPIDKSPLFEKNVDASSS